MEMYVFQNARHISRMYFAFGKIFRLERCVGKAARLFEFHARKQLPEKSQLIYATRSVQVSYDIVLLCSAGKQARRGIKRAGRYRNHAKTFCAVYNAGKKTGGNFLGNRRSVPAFQKREHKFRYS